MWNNPYGWREVVAHLKRRGYRAVCIDQKPVHGAGILYTSIPHGAEDETIEIEFAYHRGDEAILKAC
jgi:autotransporter strand-loop-strand O-heptosyltransferase